MFGVGLILFCVFVRVQSLLKVTCGVEICSCNGRACIKYEIPGTNYQIQKCMESNSCTGIYPGDYNVFQCSGIPDSGNNMVCSNQCCYFNQHDRKNVCLAPPAIGLVESEYEKICAMASRDLFKQVKELYDFYFSLKQKVEYELSSLKQSLITQTTKQKQNLDYQISILKQQYLTETAVKNTEKISLTATRQTQNAQIQSLKQTYQIQMSTLNQQVKQLKQNHLNITIILTIVQIVIGVVLFVIQLCWTQKKIKTITEKTDQQLADNVQSGMKENSENTNQRVSDLSNQEKINK